MSLGSRLKVESRGMLVTSVFYAVVGVIFLVFLPASGFQPDIAMLGILSILAAYGVFRKRAWSLWIVIILCFGAITFASFMLYLFFLTSDQLFGLSMIVYLVLTLVFTAYTAVNRKVLET